MMSCSIFEQNAELFVNDSKFNYIMAHEAIKPDYAGTRIFDKPLFGYGSAEDSLFTEMKSANAVGPQFMLPHQWLDNAVTVISFFLPFAEHIRRSNYSSDGLPSDLWLHGRIEGQRFLWKFADYLKTALEKVNYRAVIPSLDERFKSVENPSEKQTGDWKNISFASNWSERHIAYICGLGTFGLSKGLITEKGIAGRFGSIVTNAPFETTNRSYTTLYAYCSHCGACIDRCPANAISFEDGKDHYKCSEFLNGTREKYTPRYGCGKCQTNVPCERTHY